LRTLGSLATRLDALFYHRVERKVRKDGTVSYQGQRFEVPYTLSGRSVRLVVDPHAGQVLSVEDDQGESLGEATPLDAVANAHRQRRKPQPGEPASPGTARTDDATGENAVDLAYRHYHGHTKEDS
jgi:hypothetical protein